MSFCPYIVQSKDYKSQAIENIPENPENNTFTHITIKIPSLNKNISAQITDICSFINIETNVLPGKLIPDSFDYFFHGNIKKIIQLINILKSKEYVLNELGMEINAACENYNKKAFLLEFPSGKTIPLGKKTCIMGILNVTPDSFSDGGNYFNIDKAVKHGLNLQEEGADILDIGGESSRPGAFFISKEEELARIEPVLKELLSAVKIPISVDTYKSNVAERALELGADMINDISAMRMDNDMYKVIADSGVPVVLMHMKGLPRNMQINPQYNSVIDEIYLFFKDRIKQSLNGGIKPQNIIIDPGIGFGKTPDHNLEIIRSLDNFRSLGFPVLIGTSRKSLIGNVLNLPSHERMEGTAATLAISIMNGAHIIRVHDVKQMKRIALMTDALK